MLAQVSILFLFLSLVARVVQYPATADEKLLFGGVETPRVLLLTAHPDDECLFFAPTVTALLEPTRVSADRDSQSGYTDKHITPEIYSLCLSVGNADGLGETRKNELARSLDVLGIEESRRWLVDHPALPDNITRSWDKQVIADVIKPCVIENKITTILTFDRQGVSQHPNHASLPSGAAHLISSLSASSSSTLPPRLFSLTTVPQLQKYIGPLGAAVAKYDFAFAALLRRFGLDYPHRVPVFVSGVSGYRTALHAMRQHRSQLVWFRWLNVAFSRYMWVNEWAEVVPPTHTAGGAAPGVV